MILQALAKYYDDMLSRGEISAPGWGKSKVNFALCLDENGNITDIVSLGEPGDKKRNFQNLELPIPLRQTSGKAPNFLFEKSEYFFGLVNGKSNQKTIKSFESSKELHCRLLKNANDKTSKAIVSFFDSWSPKIAEKDDKLQNELSQISIGDKLVFRVCGEYAHDNCEIKKAWQKCYDNNEYRDGNELKPMQCLVSGKETFIEPVHLPIYGISNKNKTSTAIVSFNKESFCSYGKKQSFNAPVSIEAAFKYTTALNYLLDDWKNVQRIGDLTVVCWASGAEEKHIDFFNISMFGDDMNKNADINDFRATLRNISLGKSCKEIEVDSESNLYILGLSSFTKGRATVKLFMNNSFGNFIRNINDNYEKLEIKGLNQSQTIWGIVKSAVRKTPKADEKNNKPKEEDDDARRKTETELAVSVINSVLTGARYPSSLIYSVMKRIFLDRNVTASQAAIIKAYYLKNENKDCPKEVLTVSLNENSTNVAYTLGRLFSVYEAVQQAANPGINATIKDKYFNSAAARPASIFPILGNLSQKHLRKLEKGTQIYFDRQISELKAILGEEYPQTMNLAKQGSFDLGYYHQTQYRYTKKEDK